MLIDQRADLGLLQESQAPPPHIAERIQLDKAPWSTGGAPNRNWRTAVAGLSDRVDVLPWSLTTLDSPSSGALGVSLNGQSWRASQRGGGGRMGESVREHARADIYADDARTAGGLARATV
jgi:hypothetical protein